MRSQTISSPVNRVSVTVSSGTVRLVAVDGIDTMTVELAPQVDGDDAAAKAITDAEILPIGRELGVTVPPVLASRQQSSGCGVNNRISGTTFGFVIQGNDIHFAAGTIPTGADQNPVVGDGSVVATLTVPTGMTVRVHSAHGQIIGTGDLGPMSLVVGHCDVTIESATMLSAAVTYGTITVGQVQHITARTGHGAITVGDVRDWASLTTGHGAITARTATSDFHARTDYGDITITQGSGVVVAASAVHTGYGQIRVS